MKAVSVHNLSVTAAGDRLLDNLSLEGEDGDFQMIIGPNGAGKTTLLRVLCGLTPVASGRVSLLDASLADYSRRRLAAAVSLVPQHVNMDFTFTVEETVLMGRYPHLGLLAQEKKKDYAIARRAMSFTGVDRLARRHLDSLSGGERQRVMIARAICQQPRIIMLDEPTAALDPAHQLNIMQLMNRLRREEKVTVIMVSHDLNLAAMYAHRILLLKAGREVSSGTPAEIITPQNLQQAYGCNMHVDTHPLTGRPRVSLVPPAE